MQTPLLHLRQHHAYWASPSGMAALAWEQRVLDAFAERVFGYHALVIALPNLQPLRQSTIHHCIQLGGATLNDATQNTQVLGVQFDMHDWPVQNDSLDYIVLPHVLEFSDDAHAVLREAARCLRPGGSVSLTAFNPHSLLGLQARQTELGKRTDWISRRRLIDWMALLNLHTDRGAFGQWRPQSAHPQRFDRLAWIDDGGERWWPQLANIYALRAVKRLSPDLRQLKDKKESRFVLGQRQVASAHSGTH